MSELSRRQTIEDATWHHHEGRFAEAEAIYRSLLGRNPNDSQALHLLGVLAGQCSRTGIGVELIRRAIAVGPETAPLYSNLGHVLRLHGDLDQALVACRRALQLDPLLATAHNNLGNVLMDCGRLSEAISAYREAACLDPASASVQRHLGNALNHRRDFEAAVHAYQEALRLDPAYAEAYSDLANVWIAKGEIDSAISACQSALRIKNDYVDAYDNLGLALKEAGRIDEALSCHARALELAPKSVRSHSCRLFAMHHSLAFGAEALLKEHREWNQQHAQAAGHAILHQKRDSNPSRKLRIGYVSPDLYKHVLGRHLLPLIQHHDRQNFEIFCYATVLHEDEMEAEFRRLSDGWRSLAGVSDEEAVKLIQEDHIDILVDLALHTAGNRLLLFARKPAPVQMTYLGYCSTSGLDTIDYRISDWHLDPPEVDLANYSEKTLRLPSSYWRYEPAGPTPEVIASPAAANGFITFGCLNNFAKISTPALILWMRILEENPKSRFILHAPEGDARKGLMGKFIKHGLDPQRLEFVGKQNWTLYMTTWSRIDIALDPFPFNGGITTLDALWMGVPVVTLSGQTPVGRGGRSILSNLGRPEWIAYSPEEYVTIASRLASEPSELARLRNGLRARMEISPLRDALGLARDLEGGYRQAWSAWCATRTAPGTSRIDS